MKPVVYRQNPFCAIVQRFTNGFWKHELCGLHPLRTRMATLRHAIMTPQQDALGAMEPIPLRMDEIQELNMHIINPTSNCKKHIEPAKWLNS